MVLSLGFMDLLLSRVFTAKHFIDAQEIKAIHEFQHTNSKETYKIQLDA